MTEVLSLDGRAKRGGYLADGDDGLTIVELLVALTIVMIAFAALASTVITSFVSIRNAEARSQAVALANELVEEMATIPWSQLGLHEDDFDPVLLQDLEDNGETLTFPDPGDPTTGEAVVLLTDAADPVPVLSQPLQRDGRTYDVTRWVTWVEEDGQPELKRMVAIVSWQVGGRQLEIRSDGLRAPDAQDLFDLAVSVDAIRRTTDGLPGATLKQPGASPDPDDFRNEQPVRVTATVGDVDASVVLRFRDRDDVLRTVTTSNTPAGSPSVREFTISQHERRFAHGPTAFTVVATGSGGQVASDTGTFRFYQRVNVRAPDGDHGLLVSQAGTPVQNLGDDQDPLYAIGVEATTGELCAVNEPVMVEVDVRGMTSGEAAPQPVFEDGEATGDEEGGLRVVWGVDNSVEMELREGRVFGGRFFADLGEAFPLGVETTTTFTVDAHRWYPEDDPREEFEDRHNTFTFDLETVVGC